MGNDLTNIGTIAIGSNTANEVFQINERLTWVKGRHQFKFGGSWNHYNDGALLLGQQRPARVHPVQRRVLRRGVRRLPARSGAEQGPRLADGRRGRTCRTAWRSTPPTTSRSPTRSTLNLGLRWGYTSPLVEKDDRQANIDLTNAELRLAGANGNSRALYEPYYNGWEPRIGMAYRAG